MLKFKKWKWLYAAVPIVLLSGSGVGTYYLIKSQTSAPITEQPNLKSPEKKKVYREENKQEPKMEAVFPTINSNDFYEHIKVKNKDPYFTDAFKAAVINKVLNETIVILDSKTKFWYDFLIDEPQHLEIVVSWYKDHTGTYNGTSQKYTFNLGVQT